MEDSGEWTMFPRRPEIQTVEGLSPGRASFVDLALLWKGAVWGPPWASGEVAHVLREGQNVINRIKITRIGLLAGPYTRFRQCDTTQWWLASRFGDFVVTGERLLKFVDNVRRQFRPEGHDETLDRVAVVANHVSLGQRIDVGERRHFNDRRHGNCSVGRRLNGRDESPGGGWAPHLKQLTALRWSSGTKMLFYGVQMDSTSFHLFVSS